MDLKRLTVIPMLSVLAFCGWSSGQEAEPEPAPGMRPLGPDHLTTIRKQDDPQLIAYDAKLKQVLDLEQFAFARMRCGGWAEIHAGEFVLSLHGASGDRDPAKTERFFLTSRIANQNVWYTMPGSRDPRLPEETLVSVSTVPLEKGLALRLIKLWERMLERAAPRDQRRHPYTVLDGGYSIFSTATRSAEYQSMHNDRLSTGIFSDLAFTLQRYAEGSWVERRTLLKEIEEKTAALEKYLDEHPGK